MNSSRTFLFVTFILFLLLSSCASPEEREIREEPSVLIPRALGEDGSAEFYQDRIYAEDYSNTLHAIFMVAGNSRKSEMGYEGYSDTLYDEMPDRARQWLDLVQVTERTFSSGGRITDWYERVDEGFAGSGATDLSVYPHLVYSYHMHHRGSRFEEHGLLNELNFAPLTWVVNPGKYLLENHYRNGLFFHDNGRVDAASMSYGLGGIHGHIYAWVVWAKPDGADNMGVVDEDRLTVWLGFSKEETADIALEISDALDAAWNDETSMYNFTGETWTTGLMPSSTTLSLAAESGDNIWTIDQIGAMIRGHKGLYEALYMFGEGTEYQEAASQLYERTVVMFDQIQELARQWGFPSEVRFTADGAEAASDEVDVYHSWQLMNHIGGGFSWDREREGTSKFITNNNPELFDRIGELSEKLLKGALEYQINENRIAATLSYEDGSVTDPAHTISAAGMFITAAGNLYRKGSAFERASDWKDVSEEVRDRSEVLYDLKLEMLKSIVGVVME